MAYLDSPLSQVRAIASARSQLRVRTRPALDAPIVGRLAPGQMVEILGAVEGESVQDQSGWSMLQADAVCWSGGLRQAQPLQDGHFALAPVRVRRRPDGTIRPMGPRECETVFGRIEYRSQPDGSVTILNGFESRLDVLRPPLLPRPPYGATAISVHPLARPAFERVFYRLHKSGLDARILTFDGAYMARHKGWDTRRALSTHAYGIAIDLNAAFNRYGQPPALAGETGSLERILPVFADEGFAWGGDFSAPWQDGMHFELACHPRKPF